VNDQPPLLLGQKKAAQITHLHRNLCFANSVWRTLISGIYCFIVGEKFVLLVTQQKLFCQSQFNMILDIVENLLLYVEPGLREFYERVDRMRFKLRLTSADDAAKQRDTLAAMQNRIRSRLTNMRQLERQLYRADRVNFC